MVVSSVKIIPSYNSRR